jgi:hypothetical protein
MTDPVITNPLPKVEADAQTVLADTKATIASLGTDVAKVKVFWADYRTYLVCVICFLIGAYLGHKL